MVGILLEFLLVALFFGLGFAVHVLWTIAVHVLWTIAAVPGGELLR